MKMYFPTTIMESQDFHPDAKFKVKSILVEVGQNVETNAPMLILERVI